MFRKMLVKEKRTAQVYTLVLFLALSILFFAITFYAQLNINQLRRLEIETNEQSVINIQKTIIESDIRGKVSDLLYIADTMVLHNYETEDYTEVTKDWLAFSNRRKYYDQIRFIDSEGDEKIRINYTENGVEAVPEAELQNKADRYYFTEAMALTQGQVFISNLDLNVENGQIEQPIKPMMRLATPLFDQNGTQEGIVILNYSASNTLNKVRQIAATSVGSFFILNKDGYWIYYGGNESKAWGFMYEDRLAESFATEFPTEWEAIVNGEQEILDTENGSFINTRLVLNDAIAGDAPEATLICEMNAYYLVSYIPADREHGVLFSGSIVDTAWQAFYDHLSVYFLISGIAFALAAFIAVNKGQKKQIRYYSEYDVLTGVYNRRSAYARMEELRKSDAKACRIFSVCFVDINGLKEVNDRLGHKEGDELIKTAVQGMRENIRKQDFIARLGGDEFIIVFDYLNADGAQHVWERIAQWYTQLNARENRAYIISASHGISMYACGDGMSIDDIINQADEKMYAEKQVIKRNFRSIR